MGSVNKVFLLGRLGRDAEVKVTASGQSVGSFSMATSERWKDRSGQWQERTEWHRVVLWGKAAESLQPYLVKGKEIHVEGRLQTRSWEKDGQKHYSTEVVADRVTLLGGGNGGQQRRQGGDPLGDDYGAGAGYGGGVSSAAGAQFDPASVLGDDDVPF